MLRYKSRSDSTSALACFAVAFVLLIALLVLNGRIGPFALIASIPVLFFVIRFDLLHPSIHLKMAQEDSISMIEIEVVEHPLLAKGSFIRYAVEPNAGDFELNDRSVWGFGRGKVAGRHHSRVSTINKDGEKKVLWEGDLRDASSPLYV